MRPEENIFPRRQKPMQLDSHSLRHAKYNLQTIAENLSRIYRYNACSNISVLSHSMALADFFLFSNWSNKEHTLPERASLAITALLHDAHEAYLGDIALPMKRFMKDEYAVARTTCQYEIEFQWLPLFVFQNYSFFECVVHKFDKAIVVEEIQRADGLGTPYPEEGAQRHSPEAVLLVDFFNSWDSFEKRGNKPHIFLDLFHYCKAIIHNETATLPK